MFDELKCPICSKEYGSNKKRLLTALGLNPASDPTEQEINKAFREKSKIYHPDRQTGNTQLFEELNQAKEELLEIIGVKNPKIDISNNSSFEEDAGSPKDFFQEEESNSSETNQEYRFTFKEKQQLKKSLRNLRLKLKRGLPCPYCKQRY